MTPAVTAIGIIVIFAGLVAVIAKLARQPIAPAYILAGALVGPIGFGLIKDQEAIQTLADLAIVFVMFAIGLEMDLGRIKSVGKVVVLGGLIQVALTGLVGFLVALTVFGPVNAVCVGFVFAFASTTLVVKQLADKGQLDTIQGGIVLGVLLFQDILAIIIMSVAPAQAVTANDILSLLLKALGLVFGGILCSQYLFPRILRKVSDNAEIMAISSIGIGFAFGFLAESQGLSVSVGAFITGVSMANLPFELELQSRIKSLRDFFVPIFFASLGVQVVMPEAKMILPLTTIIIASLVLKPLIIAIVTALFGYQRRVCYVVGTSLVPISEFGLIIVTVGMKQGLVTGDLMTLSILAMAGSMLASAYVFTPRTDDFFLRFLAFLDKIGPDAKLGGEKLKEGEVFDTILIGFHRASRHIYEELKSHNRSVLVIEHDWRRQRMLAARGIRCLLGDALQPDLWDRLGDLSQIRLVISTIPDEKQSLFLLKFLLGKIPGAAIIPSAEHAASSLKLLEEGAAYVLCMPVIAGATITGEITRISLDPDSLEEQKKQLSNHLNRLRETWSLEATYIQSSNGWGANGNGK